MRYTTFRRLLWSLAAGCLLLASAQIVTGQGKGKKPNPGNTDRTLYEVRMVDTGDTTWNQNGLPVMTGTRGTADIPNDCASGYWLGFNPRSPNAVVDKLVPGLPNGLPGDVTIEVFPGDDKRSLVEFALQNSPSGLVYSIRGFARDIEDVPYETQEIDLADVETGCPPDDFTIDLQLIVDLFTKKGKKYVGSFGLDQLVYVKDCDQDPITPNPDDGC